MKRAEAIAATLGIALAGSPRALFAQSLPQFRAAATPIEGDALLPLAQSQGYFARAGVALDVQTLSSGEAIAAAIVGGDIVVGSMNMMSLAVAHQNGVDMKIISGGPMYESGHGGSQLMVKKDSTINSGSALNGKTLAVNVLRGAAQISSEAWIDKHGGDSKSIQWIEMPFSSMQAALEAGRIDAAEITQPYATTALATCRSIGSPNDGIATRFLNGAYVASGAWIAAHPDAARKIKSGLIACAHWYNTDPGASVQAVAAITKQDPAVVAKSVRTIFGEEVTPPLVQPVIDAGAKYGLLKRGFPAAEIIAAI